MRKPRAASPAPETPLHSHPAVARWMAELRRQQRRKAPASTRARTELALLRQARS